LTVNGVGIGRRELALAAFQGRSAVVPDMVWQGFEPAKREQPIKIGLIEIEPQWGRASNDKSA
jgi:hypothetical protein